MSQGRNANYILKRMKKDAATVVPGVVRASNEEICLLSCRYIVRHEWLVSFNDEFRKKPITTSPICVNKLSSSKISGDANRFPRRVTSCTA